MKVNMKNNLINTNYIFLLDIIIMLVPFRIFMVSMYKLQKYEVQWNFIQHSDGLRQSETEKLMFRPSNELKILTPQGLEDGQIQDIYDR